MNSFIKMREKELRKELKNLIEKLEIKERIIDELADMIILLQQNVDKTTSKK